MSLLLDCLLTVETAFNSHYECQVALVDFYVAELIQIDVYCPEKLVVETILRGIEKFTFVRAVDRLEEADSAVLVDLYS